MEVAGVLTKRGEVIKVGSMSKIFLLYENIDIKIESRQ